MAFSAPSRMTEMQHTGSDLAQKQAGEADCIVFGTFGIYRYCLAVLVVISHCDVKRWQYVGMYAVFAFYILSGYVVSYILHQKYLRVPNGIRRYFVNRFLRIFPLYWAMLAFSLWVNILFPAESNAFMPLQGVPDSVTGWMKNLSTLCLVNPVTGNWQPPLVLQPAWSLGIEITYWIAMPLLLTHDLLRRGFMTFAVLYLLAALKLSLNHSFLDIGNACYLNIFAAALPFFIGLALLLRKTRNPAVLPRPTGIAGIAAFLALLASVPFLSSEAQPAGFYLSVAISALIVMVLAQIDQNTLPVFWRKLDLMCGHIAYPLYLVHVPTTVLLRVLIPSLAPNSFGLTVLSIFGSTLTAYLAYQLIDVRVERLREGLRPSIAARIPMVA